MRSQPQHLLFLTLLGAAAVTACDRSTPDEARPLAPAVTWSTQVGGAGIALVLQGESGEELMRLACTRDPARMSVVVETFRAVGSEERLSLGVDDEPFVFVADPTAERPAGVQAEAPIEAELLDRFAGARQVSAVYGAQTLGPHPAPDRDLSERFAQACRQLLGGGG
jgi:hypothetical protein